MTAKTTHTTAALLKANLARIRETFGEDVEEFKVPIPPFTLHDDEDKYSIHYDCLEACFTLDAFEEEKPDTYYLYLTIEAGDPPHEYCGNFHPHINDDGDLCYGEYYGEFNKARKILDYETIIDLLHICLQNYDPRDCYVKITELLYGEDEESGGENFCRWTEQYVDETRYSDYHRMCIDVDLLVWSDYHDSYIVQEESYWVARREGKDICDYLLHDIALDYRDYVWVDDVPQSVVDRLSHYLGVDVIYIDKELLYEDEDGEFQLKEGLPV
jgi:hypothetical protein